MNSHRLSRRRLLAGVIGAGIAGCVGYQAGAGDRAWVEHVRALGLQGPSHLVGDDELAFVCFHAQMMGMSNGPVPTQGIRLAAVEPDGVLRWQTSIGGSPDLEPVRCEAGLAIADGERTVHLVSNGAGEDQALVTVDAPIVALASTGDAVMVVTSVDR